MTLIHRALVPVALLVAALLHPAQADDGPSDDEIARAIARGVQHLKGTQEPAGGWTYSYSQDHRLGITALAGLALLENGVERADPVIARATETIVTLAARSNQTYDLALATLFLARVQQESQGSHDALIRRLATRLADGQRDGMWGYFVPLASDEETQGRRRGGARPSALGPADNSNTQFALLGVWAASRHGFDANEALAAIDHHFRSSRISDGHWGYRPGMPGGDSMTCAGLMGLAITSARPELAERQTARARGAALAADPAFAEALHAVASDAHRIGPGSDIYYLWSLERVCVALGLRRLEDFDWYAAGAQELLRRQRPDGSWPDHQWGSLPNTCLALLFLRKANLAFEIDRVLKLPDAGKPHHAEVAAPAAPEEPPGEVGGDARVIVTGASDARFPEIQVEFEVKRPDESYLLDARRDDFHVTESGVEMPILSVQAPVSSEARPITVVLVVDRSRSMEEEDRIGALKKAVGSFVKGLPAGSRVAVVAFGSDVKVICPFTGDFAQVVDAANGLSPAGATRYYDAVAEALALLERESGRRAVLALTDGEDTFSQSATLDSAVKTAVRLGLPIHTLGLGSEDEIESDSLKKLAASTRGQYYPAREADQLRTIYEALAQRLRSSYSLVYRTDRKLPDGTLRPIRVSYRTSRQEGETAVFVHGMVVPAAGWPALFLGLLAVLATLAAVPGFLGRRAPRDRA
ncbi:MAG: VWA domain-containing protein [Isosphaeraceae bacterium]|nr:VWA domain-containing protein [Isosphaeraceae bacterium]